MPKIKVILCVAYSAIEDKYNTYIMGDYDEDTGIYTQPYLLKEDLVRFKKLTTVMSLLWVKIHGKLLEVNLYPIEPT